MLEPTHFLPCPDTHDGFPLLNGDADSAGTMARLERGGRVGSGGGRFERGYLEGGRKVVEGG